MTLKIVNPDSLERPRGFSHGVVAPAGARLVFVAGQTATDAEGIVRDIDFAVQFDAALGKVLTVVRAAGGDAASIARMTVYVTDVQQYRASRPRLSEAWKRHMQGHYPAMALVAVAALVDEGAVVEIAADAVLDGERA